MNDNKLYDNLLNYLITQNYYLFTDYTNDKDIFDSKFDAIYNHYKNTEYLFIAICNKEEIRKSAFEVRNKIYEPSIFVTDKKITDYIYNFNNNNNSEEQKKNTLEM